MGGGYSRFQVTGMIEGFFGGFKVFDSRIFWAGQFGKNFFGWLNLSRDFFHTI